MEWIQTQLLPDIQVRQNSLETEKFLPHRYLKRHFYVEFREGGSWEEFGQKQVPTWRKYHDDHRSSIDDLSTCPHGHPHES